MPPNNNWDSEFRHYLVIYWEFKAITPTLSAEEVADDLVNHISSPDKSLREAVIEHTSRPRSKMPPRVISHPVRDWDALDWARDKADERCEM